MATVTASEARTRFGELLDRVVADEEIIITRRGKPVARLIHERSPNLAEVRRAGEALESLQKEIAASPGGKRAISREQFKSFVEEGRR